MTRKPKKQSSEFYLAFLVLNSAGILLFLYAIFFQINYFLYLIIACVFILGFLIPESSRFQYNRAVIHLQQKACQERIEILTKQNQYEAAYNNKLASNLRRYQAFQSSIEPLATGLSLAETIQLISAQMDQLFSEATMTCSLYIFHSKTGELGISVSNKGQMKINEGSVKGDIFDQWLVKNMQPLSIQDTGQDERFKKILPQQKDDEVKAVRSLISVPLILENKALGILRVDSLKEKSFDTEDVLFLYAIASVVAVAIENAELAEHMHELGIKDSLTGLYLRKYLMDSLDATAARHLKEKQDLSFLMIDLDHFKNYNDTFGHIAGDIVLRTVAMILADFFRQEDQIVCRYGGEEFCVLLPRCSKEKAASLAEELRKKLEGQTIILRRQKTHVTVSIGVATLPQDAQSKENLIDAADQALYAAKNTGRNKVVVYPVNPSEKI